MRAPKSFLKIVTRAKESADDSEDKSPPRIVELTVKKLEAYFSLPLNIAAERIGISLTALKW
jgi:hypothetical protein